MVVIDRRPDGVLVVQVVGPFRWPTHAELGRKVETLLGLGGRSFVVDLAHVPSIDAAGLGELARLHTMVMSAGAELRVRCASGMVRRLIGIVGLREILTADSRVENEKCS